MDSGNIGALIAQGKIVKLADIDPNNDYIQIGKFQTGNRKRGSSNADAYAPYAIPLSLVLGGGSVYTGSNGIVLIGNDFQFASNNISQFTNDSGYLTAATVGNVAWKLDGNTVGVEKFLGTIDNFALPFRVNNNEVARFTTDGAGLTRLYINQTTNLHGSNAGIQYSTTFANRAQPRLNAYGNHGGIAGITGFKSRGTNIGDTLSVLAGDTLFRITALGISGDNASLNLAALIDVKVTAGGVFPAYVATDFTVDLMDVTGIRSEKFRVNHSGTVTVNNIYTLPNVDGTANQVLKTNGLGIVTWQSDVAGPIPTTAGNTLLTCITDIFVQNVNSCSPLNINASNGQHVYMVAGGGNVGVGTVTTTAKVHIRGDDSTISFYALKVQDVAGNPLFNIQNNGYIGIGTAFSSNIVDLWTGSSKVRLVTGALSTNVFEIQDLGYGLIYGIEGVYGRVKFGTTYTSAPATLMVGDYGVQKFIGFGNNAEYGYFNRFSRGVIFTGVDNVDGDQFILSADSTYTYPTRTAYFKKDVAIGWTTPTARLHVRGDATATDYAMKIENNAGIGVIRGRNNGEVALNSLPTSGTGVPPVGLVSGDLWHDLLSNIVMRIP